MSPLPNDFTAWPPPGHSDRYRRMRRNSVWYGGDPKRLEAEYGSSSAVVHGGPGTTLNPTPGLAKRVYAAVRNEFWATSSNDEKDTKRHLPTPQDISTISSEMLFGDPPSVKVAGPTYEVDGPLDADGQPLWRKGDPTADTQRAQKRLDYVLQSCNFHSTLLAAAEVSSALGSTGLRIAFDKSGDIKDRPVITRVDADAIIPNYSWGQLISVTFWQVLAVDKNDVIWRHLELHEAGRVYHGLYKGDSHTLGQRQPLAAQPATAALSELVDADGGITILSNGGKTATSIPNVLPDPLDRASNAGRSDYTPPVLDLFDAIDRVYSQMMDTIEDAKSRLIISDSMLERRGAGEGVGFDSNQRIFTKVKLPPSEREGGGIPIEKIQFDMHVAEYLQAIEALTSKAVRAAGYNPQTMGDEAGAAMTATEYAGRNKRSMSTRDKKIRYWQPELSAILTSLLAVDVEQFAPRDPDDNTAIIAYPVEVTFPDAVQPTIRELADTAKALKDAEAASKFTLVKTVHPDWNDTQVQEEVDRILAQNSVIDPVTFGLAGQGTSDSMLGDGREHDLNEGENPDVPHVESDVDNLDISNALDASQPDSLA